MVFGGADNDTAHGGDGDDTFIAEASDGDDIYYGDAGSDTPGHGSDNRQPDVRSRKRLQGPRKCIEQPIRQRHALERRERRQGSGNDTITANASANISMAGPGNDRFVFLSEKDADGDTIIGFQPGDKIDLSGTDANNGVSGNQAFTLVCRIHAQRCCATDRHPRDGDDGDYTVVQASVDGDSSAELRLSVKGNHKPHHFRL